MVLCLAGGVTATCHVSSEYFARGLLDDYFAPKSVTGSRDNTAGLLMRFVFTNCEKC